MKRENAIKIHSATDSEKNAACNVVIIGSEKGKEGERERETQKGEDE